MVDAEGSILRSVLASRVFQGQGLLVPFHTLLGASGLTPLGADPGRPVIRQAWSWSSGRWVVLDASGLERGEGADLDLAPLPASCPVFTARLDRGGLTSWEPAGLLERSEDAWVRRGGGPRPGRLLFCRPATVAGVELLPLDPFGSEGAGGEFVPATEILQAWPHRALVPLDRLLLGLERDAGAQLLLLREAVEAQDWPRVLAHGLTALEADPRAAATVEEWVARAGWWLTKDQGAEFDETLAQALERALGLLPGNADLGLATALARADRGRIEDALWLLDGLRAVDLELFLEPDLLEARRALSLDWCEQARRAGTPGIAVERALEGLRRVPEDARLLQALGYAQVESGRPESALDTFLQLTRIDPGSAVRFDALLQRLEKATDPGHVAILPFDPAEGGIFAQASFDGRAARVLVDTGASFTAISEGLARRLGLDLASVTRRARVETASGTLHDRPVVTLGVVDLAGAVQRQVDAVVMPLDGRGQPEALIGMNFLGRYEVGIDAELGRMWLNPLR